MELEKGTGGRNILVEPSYIPGVQKNQAVAAARLGGRVTFAVGSEMIPMENSLANRDDNIDTFKIDDEHQTGLAVIPAEADGENRIMVFPNK